jgi:hypothetical protein
LWLLAILFLPILGVLIYFLVRPKTIDTWAPESDMYTPEMARYQSTQSSGAVKEIEQLLQLKEQGKITEEEFNQLKQRVLAS